MKKLIKQLREKIKLTRNDFFNTENKITITIDDANEIIKFYDVHSYSSKSVSSLATTEEVLKGLGKFVLTTRKNGQFQFSLKAGNGQEILGSKAYTTKAACMNGIESVKKNSTEDGRYDRLTSKNDRPYFNLKAGNGQIIGTSEMYESEASRENGIASVMKNAPDATVEDQTEA